MHRRNVEAARTATAAGRKAGSALRAAMLALVLPAMLAACAQLQGQTQPKGDPVVTNSIAPVEETLPPGTVMPAARPGESMEQRLARLEYDLAQLRLDYSIVRPSFEHLVSRERELTGRVALLEDITGPITASVKAAEAKPDAMHASPKPAAVPPEKHEDGDMKEQPAPAAPAEKTAAKGTPLGVHLASYRTREKVEAGWMELVAGHPDKLSTLQPKIQRVDLGESGIFQRLIAGPLASPDAAQKLCKSLEKDGIYCKQMSYTGDPL